MTALATALNQAPDTLRESIPNRPGLPATGPATPATVRAWFDTIRVMALTGVTNYLDWAENAPTASAAGEMIANARKCMAVADAIDAIDAGTGRGRR